MDIFLSVFRYIGTYPHSVLLAFIAILNLFWVFKNVFSEKNYTKPLYKLYFAYSFFILLWVLIVAYFESPLAFYYGDIIPAKFFSSTANVVSVFAATIFFYISCFLRFPRGKIPLFYKIFTAFSFAQAFVLNVIPGLIYKKFVALQDHMQFDVAMGPATEFFYGFIVFLILFAFTNFILAIKNKRETLENIRFFYIFLGMSLMYGSVIIFHIIFSHVLGDFRYSWVPPFLSFVDILIFGYAIKIKESDIHKIQLFSDIAILVVKVIKFIISSFITLLLAYILYYFSDLFYILFAQFALSIILLLSAYFFFFLQKFFNSQYFYKIFNLTSLEYFQYILQRFQAKNKVYEDLEDFKKDLYTMFARILMISKVDLILLDKKKEEDYPAIVSYFKKNQTILLERALKEDVNQETDVLLKELSSLGYICFALFSPTRSLIGLFVLGKKDSGGLYSTEEIESLEQFVHFLSFRLFILNYQEELQMAIKKGKLEISKKNENLKKVLAQQADFIALSAHELRTPVSVIKASLEVLSFEKLNENVKKRVNAAYRATVKMGQLVEKLFEVQSFDLEKIEISPECISLDILLEGIEQEVKNLTKDKKIDFSLFIEKETKQEKVYVDAIRMRQVLFNLISNAKNFTPKKGQLSLSIIKKDSAIQFQVIDNGEGVEESLKEEIFDKFRGGHVMYSPGIGLGLYLSKKIIELHKGQIWVEDTQGGGATFIVEIPCKK